MAETLGKHLLLFLCFDLFHYHWVRKISWRRKWQPTPVFLPGKSHGQRSLVGYSPRGRKESYTAEQLHFHFGFFAVLVAVFIIIIYFFRFFSIYFY